MRILVVSDTHGYGDRYYEILENMDELDLVIHCGDVEGAEEELEMVTRNMCNCPIVMVAGNNDYFSNLRLERELLLEEFHILVTHGHHYYVSMGTEIIKKEAAARGFQIAMYGHTHRPLVEQDRHTGVIVMNPGSLSYPRQEGRRPSYIIMELEKGCQPEIEIHYL